MAADDYEWYSAVNSQYNGGLGTLTAGTGDYVWQHAQQLVARLKAMTVAPWVTRGSSRVNAAVATFSATPDGVDNWSTLTGTVAQFCGTGSSSSPWHILENPLTGWQVRIQVHPTTAPQTSGYLEIAVAKNKFETGGAWRNAGSVTAAIAPADTTSSPTVDREQSSGQDTGSTLPPFDSLNTRYRNVIGNRPDGKGFYSFSMAETPSLSAGNLQFCTVIGTAPQVLHGDQAALTTNTQAVFRFIGDALTNGCNIASPDTAPATTWRMKVRENDGSTKNCAGLETCFTNGTVVFSGATAAVADSAYAKLPIGPLAWFSNNTFVLRGALPDVWIVPSSFNSLGSFNLLQYMKIGRFLWPWDGVTSLGGTARVGYFWAPTGTEPATPGYVDPKAFNRGLEIL